jgi:hypothetical protein
VYLEPGTTVGNFEAGISKYVVTIRPLQFTHCADMKVFVALPLEINSYFYSSNSFLCN